MDRKDRCTCTISMFTSSMDRKDICTCTISIFPSSMDRKDRCTCTISIHPLSMDKGLNPAQFNLTSRNHGEAGQNIHIYETAEITSYNI